MLYTWTLFIIFRHSDNFDWHADTQTHNNVTWAFVVFWYVCLCVGINCSSVRNQIKWACLNDRNVKTSEMEEWSGSTTFLRQYCRSQLRDSISGGRRRRTAMILRRLFYTKEFGRYIYEIPPLVIQFMCFAVCAPAAAAHQFSSTLIKPRRNICKRARICRVVNAHCSYRFAYIPSMLPFMNIPSCYMYMLLLPVYSMYKVAPFAAMQLRFQRRIESRLLNFHSTAFANTKALQSKLCTCAKFPILILPDANETVDRLCRLRSFHNATLANDIL